MHRLHSCEAVPPRRIFDSGGHTLVRCGIRDGWARSDRLGCIPAGLGSYQKCPRAVASSRGPRWTPTQNPAPIHVYTRIDSNVASGRSRPFPMASHSGELQLELWTVGMHMGTLQSRTKSKLLTCRFSALPSASSQLAPSLAGGHPRASIQTQRRVEGRGRELMGTRSPNRRVGSAFALRDGHTKRPRATQQIGVIRGWEA